MSFGSNVSGMENQMGNQVKVLILVSVCLAVLAVGALRRKTEWLLNMLLRAVLGMVMIFFVNEFLAGRGIETCVGINVITFLTSGILGFPGLAALYGLGFYNLL